MLFLLERGGIRQRIGFTGFQSADADFLGQIASRENGVGERRPRFDTDVIGIEIFGGGPDAEIGEVFKFHRDAGAVLFIRQDGFALGEIV